MRARFFCQNCGTEVSANAGKCPSCGRYFAAVNCPRCGFQGEAAEFLKGCPACGYAMEPLTGKSPGMRKAKGKVSGGNTRAGARLPPAFYRAAGILLLGALIGLVVLLIVRA